MGLSYANEIFVVARDRKRKLVLLGGLGAAGVGQMWAPEDDEVEHRRPGWDEAPEQEAPSPMQLHDHNYEIGKICKYRSVMKMFDRFVGSARRDSDEMKTLNDLRRELEKLQPMMSPGMMP